MYFSMYKDNGIMQVQNFSTGTDKYGNWYINGAFVVLKNVTVMTKVLIVNQPTDYYIIEMCF